MADLYNRIALFRAERSLSRRELAESVEVNVQTIGYLERGDYKPSLELAMKIAAVFDVPVELVFSFTPFPSIAASLRRAGLRRLHEAEGRAGRERGRPAMNDASRLKNLMLNDNGFGFDPSSGFTYNISLTGLEVIHWLKEGMSEPKIVERVAPAYPEAAREEKVQGAVVVEVTIGTDGRVSDAKAIEDPDARLTAAALEAVAQWRFEPARTAQGKAVAVRLAVTVNFKLS